MTPAALQPTRIQPALRTVAVTGAAAAMLWAASGCAVARPDARATDARIVETSGAAARVDIALELKNTGDDEVELVEYDYVVTLGDGSSYGGKWAALRALPPGRTVEATIPAVLPAASVGAGQVPWSVSGTLRYRDPQSIARIFYEAGILKTEISFSGTGSALKPIAPAPAAATGQ
jgi:hypothetical protein